MGEGPKDHTEDDSLGVYLHIPFCERICPYCDFAVVAARPLRADDEQRYVDALLRELELRCADWPGRRLATLYLGGGTPSLLHADSVARLHEAATRSFAGGTGVEVTLEVNPGSSAPERLRGFRDAGVNRLSIGVQSFDDAKLRRLGRAHRAEESFEMLAAAREAGFENSSIDLMFRAPGESMEGFEADLEHFATAGSQHVSAYELMIEEETPFWEAEKSGRLGSRVDEDQVAEMIAQVDDRLTGAGFGRYELASYAQPGFESAHNRRYWERSPVLALGLGAWSSEPKRADAPHGGRRSNLRGLSAYLERLEAGELPDDSQETLSAATARGEAMFLGLRRTQGVDAARFAREFGGPPRRFYDAAIDALQRQALIEERLCGDLVLTSRGRLLADSVGEHFV
jgi:oxygen-independent coproporphyrinogen-3 oxidase